MNGRELYGLIQQNLHTLGGNWVVDEDDNLRITGYTQPTGLVFDQTLGKITELVVEWDTTCLGAGGYIHSNLSPVFYSDTDFNPESENHNNKFRILVHNCDYVNGGNDLGTLMSIPPGTPVGEGDIWANATQPTAQGSITPNTRHTFKFEKRDGYLMFYEDDVLLSIRVDDYANTPLYFGWYFWFGSNNAEYSANFIIHSYTMTGRDTTHGIVNRYVGASALRRVATIVKNYVDNIVSKLVNKFVTLDSEQTITSIKTITGGNQGKMVFKNSNYTKGDSVEAATTISKLYFGNSASYDNSNAVLATGVNSSGDTYVELCAINNTANDSSRSALILQYNKSESEPQLLQARGNFIPYADSTYDLGSSSLQWNNIYTNQLYLNGTEFKISDIPTRVNDLANDSDFIPNTDNTHTLGDSTHRWIQVWSGGYKAKATNIDFTDSTTTNAKEYWPLQITDKNLTQEVGCLGVARTHDSGYNRTLIRVRNANGKWAQMYIELLDDNNFCIGMSGSDGTINNGFAGNAATATKATNNAAGKELTNTIIKGLSVSGKTITYTQLDDTTGTITTQDTVYTHPTTAGNKHIPSGGSSGQFLGWDSNGTAKWVNNPNTDTLVNQNVSTTNGTYPVLIAATANATANLGAKAAYFGSGVKVNPSTSTISATTFSGALVGNVTGNCSGSSGSCTGNAATATQFSANTTVALTGDATGTSAGSKKGWSVPVTLANSGVTAGTYGPSADVTGNNNATISVPEITVDAKGRVTSVTNRTLTCKNNTYNVYNKTLTIQKNGTNVATFTSNSNTDVTANITVPTKVSELTNDSGFLTSHQSLSNYVTLNGAQTIPGAKTFTGNIIGINKDSSTEDANSLYSTTAGSKLTYYTTTNGNTTLTNVPAAVNTTLESRTIRRLSNSDWIVEQICHNSNGLYYRKGSNGTWGAWKTFAFTDSNISGNAATATKATGNANGKELTNTIIKGLSISGKTITYTQLDDTTGTITTQDTVYTHPTTAGNKHIPSGGSSGQILKYSASGTAVWADVSFTRQMVSIDTDSFINALLPRTRTVTLTNSQLAVVTVNLTTYEDCLVKLTASNAYVVAIHTILGTNAYKQDSVNYGDILKQGAAGRTKVVALIYPYNTSVVFTLAKVSGDDNPFSSYSFAVYQ